MKKILMTLLIAVFLLGFASLPATAQTRGVQINFEWDQSNIQADFWGWRMYVGSAASGPYDLLGKDANDEAIPLMVIPYDSANPTGPFTGTGSLIAPDNAETTYYFVVVAFDTNGNFSGNSNEVNYMADFLGPDPPVLSITGTIIITPPTP